MDMQGFGLSEGWQGRRGNMDRLDDFAKDVAQKLTLIATQIRRRRVEMTEARAGAPALPPLYVAGYSLGGVAVLTALELLAKKQHALLDRSAKGEHLDAKLEGVAAFAPMLSIYRLKSIPINRLALAFGNILSRFAPHCPVFKTTPNGKTTWLVEHKLEVSQREGR